MVYTISGTTKPGWSLVKGRSNKIKFELAIKSKELAEITAIIERLFHAPT